MKPWHVVALAVLLVSPWLAKGVLRACADTDLTEVHGAAILDDHGDIVAIGFDGVRVIVEERNTYKKRLEIIEWALVCDAAQEVADANEEDVWDVRLRWIKMVLEGLCDA